MYFFFVLLHLCFVICIGPNEETLNEWWILIWDQKISTIVMTTNTVEQNEVGIQIRLKLQ